MATVKSGKPYFWTTWVAKQLGGDMCRWSAWFRSRHRYDRFEEMAGDLSQWNREHTALMLKRQRQLEADGWTVEVESQNAFKLEGEKAIVAGKPDLIATKGDVVRIIDGKTGREKDSDVFQVLIYLYALPLVKPSLAGKTLIGEVEYSKSRDVVTLTPEALDAGALEEIVGMVSALASKDAPAKVPSRDECRKCNIGPRDCPQRVMQDQNVAQVGAF